MKPFAAFLLMVLAQAGLGGSDPLETALEAYRRGNYELAVRNFEALLPKYPLQADRIKFNLAQCHLALKHADKAAGYYREVLQRLPAAEQSKAYSNLGILAANNNKVKDALDLVRQALIADPSNENARANYEILMRRLPPPPPEDDPPPPPPPPQARPKPQEGLGGAGVLPEMAREDAYAAMERLKQQERQYLQEQRKRAKQRQRYIDSPDW